MLPCEVQPPSALADRSAAPLSLLRRAIDETGWKHAAIAAALGVEPQYLSRMLSGEKVWTVRHLQLLPDDVERRFIELYAESFGLLIVRRVDDATAQMQLASGLFNLLAPRLPVKATAMARAELPAAPAKARAR